MKFEPKTLDYNLSPYTGLTRETWLEAGKYMLEGIFQNIVDFIKKLFDFLRISNFLDKEFWRKYCNIKFPIR